LPHSLPDTAPEIVSVAAVTRRHIEDYKPWLAARPGQKVARLTPNTIAHRLGNLRTFFSAWTSGIGTTRPTGSRS
jgi:hypothetical protein